MCYRERNDNRAKLGPFVAIMLSLGACSGDTPVTPAIMSPSTPAATVSLTLALSKPSTGIPVAESVTVVATTKDNTGTVMSPAVPVTWRTSDSTIASVTAFGSTAATVIGKHPGVVTITATLPGLTATIAVVVLPGEDTAAPLLVIESFRMVEFQYPGYADWFYAPQIRLRETRGASGAVMTKLEFVIPGLLAAPPCNASVPVGSGQTIDLFQEIYGDYQYTISATGVRASGADATAIMTVTDGRGRNTKLVVTGPVVPGALPTTYTGGNPAWTCSFP